MRKNNMGMNGTLTRRDWLQHFCNLNKNSEFLFRSNLREVFIKFDADNNG